jgi:hypothetical protein
MSTGTGSHTPPECRREDGFAGGHSWYVSEANASDKRRTVLVVHGRNLAAKDAMFSFLRALDLRPLEWGSIMRATGQASPHIGDILKTGFGLAQAVVVLSTPDDVAHLRGEYAERDGDAAIVPADQARPNVLFEAGMAMGWNDARTVLVELGRVRGLSDLAGRHVLQMTETSEKRHELVERLRTAGLDVDTSGSGWLSAGDFTPPPASTHPKNPSGARDEPATPERSGAVRDGTLTLTPGRRKRGSFGGVEMSVRAANDADGRHLTGIVVRATFVKDGEPVGSAIGTITDLAPGASKYTDLTGTDDVDEDSEVVLQVDSSF